MAYFRGRDQQQLIFDSKNSNVDRFLRSADSPSLQERILNFFLAPLKALALGLGIGRQVNARFMGQEVSVHRLDTQGMFDGVSCGYHSSGAVLAMAEYIGMNHAYASDDIQTLIRHSSGLDNVAERMLEHPPIPSVSPALTQLGAHEGSGRLVDEDLDLPQEPRAPEEPLLGQGPAYDSVEPSTQSFAGRKS